MYLDRILYPITALGPGERIAIWVAGCSRECPYCANPELWSRHDEQKIEPERLANYINTMKDKKIDGITITGGEPFDQVEALIGVINELQIETEILVFTGYKIEEIKENPVQNRLLKAIDVLIDGEYINELNDGKSTLRGSTNQRIHYLNSKVIPQYEEYLIEGRKIQNFVYEYNTLSVGIHNP